MKKEQMSQSRRSFLLKTIPACAAVCAIQPVLPALGKINNPAFFDGHKFDEEFPGKMTHRMFFEMRYSQFINAAKLFSENFGEDKVIDILKEDTTKRMTRFGEMQAKRDGAEASFKKFTDKFRGGYENSLTKEVVKDTDTIFELKVTECIWAEAFKKFKGEKFGTAAVCHGDYSWASGYSPKLRMERDKTLMEGHECCNHCYIWEE